MKPARLEAAILLDLDGTLTDPRVGIVSCLKHALEKIGVVAPADEVLESYIGPPLHESLAQLPGTAARSQLDDAVAFYRERFTTQGMFENRVYPGMAEALGELREMGARLFVATSKPQPFAEQILEHFGLRRLFDGVYGSGLDGKLSNKSELIFHVLKEERLPASDAAMVGDRAQDIKGAEDNDIFSIGALWGYGSREELTSAGAKALCDSARDLAGTVSLNFPFYTARATKPTRAG